MSVPQVHRACHSLLIMTSENDNAKDELDCFAQVALNSYGHISLWGTQLDQNVHTRGESFHQHGQLQYSPP